MPDAPQGDMPGWRDTHVRVEGPIVAHLQRLFIGHWVRYSPIALEGDEYFPALAATGTQRVALAACDAGRRRNPFYRALLGAIGAGATSRAADRRPTWCRRAACCAH
jgi:cardiolipin synthase